MAKANRFSVVPTKTLPHSMHFRLDFRGHSYYGYAGIYTKSTDIGWNDPSGMTAEESIGSRKLNRAVRQAFTMSFANGPKNESGERKRQKTWTNKRAKQIGRAKNDNITPHQANPRKTSRAKKNDKITRSAKTLRQANPSKNGSGGRQTTT